MPGVVGGCVVRGDAGVRRRRVAAPRSSAAAAAAAAADDLLQLVAEHPPAHRVQEEVDGEPGDVQRLAVVADDPYTAMLVLK